MRLYAAGGKNKKFYDEAAVRHKVPRLYSFLLDQKNIAGFNLSIPLMVDSGAHSYNKFTIGHVGMKGSSKALPPPLEFLKFYKEYILKYPHAPRITFVELDVYGLLPKNIIDDCYREIYEKVGVRLIRVYHKMIDGGSLEIIDQWIEEGNTYIGLGLDSIPTWDKLFLKTKDKIKYHGFANTKMNYLEKYPFYSADSTTPLIGCIYGGFLSPNLKYLGKKRLVKNKRIEILIDRDNDATIELSLKNFKSTETYLTKLWEKRGVVWED